MVAPEQRFFLKAQSFSNENDFDTAFDSLASEHQIIAAAPCITHASGSHALTISLLFAIIAEAGGHMIVDQPDRLHVGINNGRAYKFKTQVL